MNFPIFPFPFEIESAYEVTSHLHFLVYICMCEWVFALAFNATVWYQSCIANSYSHIQSMRRLLFICCDLPSRHYSISFYFLLPFFFFAFSYLFCFCFWNFLFLKLILWKSEIEKMANLLGYIEGSVALWPIYCLYFLFLILILIFFGF